MEFTKNELKIASKTEAIEREYSEGLPPGLKAMNEEKRNLMLERAAIVREANGELNAYELQHLLSTRGHNISMSTVRKLISDFKLPVKSMMGGSRRFQNSAGVSAQEVVAMLRAMPGEPTTLEMMEHLQSRGIEIKMAALHGFIQRYQIPYTSRQGARKKGSTKRGKGIDIHTEQGHSNNAPVYPITKDSTHKYNGRI